MLLYSARIMFKALRGTPSVERRSNMYVCDMDGKADAKSKNTSAPLLFVRDVVIAA